MISFIGGPADEKRLALQRAPYWLRVVVDQRGEVDALDLLSDTARKGETVYVYRCVNFDGSMIICSRGKGCRTITTAQYQYHDEQPPQSVLRDNEQWREWATQKGMPKP